MHKIIDSTRIIEREYEDKYGKNTEYTLAIVTTDGNEFYISKDNLVNWDSLNSVSSKGKKLKALLRNTSNRTENKIPLIYPLMEKQSFQKK